MDREAQGDLEKAIFMSKTGALAIGDKDLHLICQNSLLDILTERCGVMMFEYNVKQDIMYCMRRNKQRKKEEHEIHDYKAFIKERNSSVPEDAAHYLGNLERGCSKVMRGTFDYHLRFWSDAPSYYRAVYQSLADLSGNIYALVGYTEDISEETVRSQQKVAVNEQRDSLTKMYNRDMTERLINEHLEHLPSGEKGVLFLLDIDNFRQVNEKLGVMAGDGYLRAISEAVRADFRGADILGRVGGDEFVIFMHGSVSIDTIERKAQHIIDIFMRVPLENFTSAACSIGIAATTSAEMKYGLLQPKAEKALASAKKRGHNRYCMYGEDRY